MQNVPRFFRDGFRIAKRVVRAALGTDHLLRCEVRIPRRRLGSDYGGWTICPDLLNETGAIVYSVGLGHDISFDLSLAEATKCRIFGFDPTPKARKWIEQQQLPPSFQYIPVGLAERDGFLDFGVPSQPSFDDFTLVRGHTGQTVTCEVAKLSTLAHRLGHTKIDLLKMDIEGAEYRVIDDICDGSLLPGQLLIEFHHRIDGAQISDTRRSIARLRGVGYQLFNVSPSGRELSFVRKCELSRLQAMDQPTRAGAMSG